jgi:hypothetical protein
VELSDGPTALTAVRGLGVQDNDGDCPRYCSTACRLASNKHFGIRHVTADAHHNKHCGLLQAVRAGCACQGKGGHKTRGSRSCASEHNLPLRPFQPSTRNQDMSRLADAAFDHSRHPSFPPTWHVPDK